MILFDIVQGNLEILSSVALVTMVMTMMQMIMIITDDDWKYGDNNE